MSEHAEIWCRFRLQKQNGSNRMFAERFVTQARRYGKRKMYDQLVDIIRTHLDMDMIYEMIGRDVR